MMEEESEAIIEITPGTNTRKTIISLVILALMTAGLLFWWLMPRRAAETATTPKSEEKAAEKKSKRIASIGAVEIDGALLGIVPRMKLGMKMSRI